MFGPTYHRQVLANLRHSTCYVEGHLNASTSPAAKYACVIVSDHASIHSRAWAADFLKRVCKEFGLPNGGVASGVRGSANISRVKCPAILIEPGFVSDPGFARVVSSGEGIDALGRVLAESIRAQFPTGGEAVLSIGHAYRGNGDMGANVVGAEDPAFDQEAELVEAYLNAATEYLLQ